MWLSSVRLFHWFQVKTNREGHTFSVHSYPGPSSLKIFLKEKTECFAIAPCVVTPSQKVSNPCKHKLVYSPIGYQLSPVTQVMSPFAWYSVQANNYPGQRVMIALVQFPSYATSDMLYPRLRWFGSQPPVIILAVPLRSKRIAQRIEIHPAGISDTGLKLVESEFNVGHHQTDLLKILHLLSATQYYKVIRIVYDSCPILTPGPKKPFNVATGKQRANCASLENVPLTPLYTGHSRPAPIIPLFHESLQPLLDQLQNLSMQHATNHTLHDLVVRKYVKISGHVRIPHLRVSLLTQCSVRLAGSILSAPPWPISVNVILKIRLENGSMYSHAIWIRS